MLCIFSCIGLAVGKWIEVFLTRRLTFTKVQVNYWQLWICNVKKWRTVAQIFVKISRWKTIISSKALPDIILKSKKTDLHIFKYTLFSHVKFKGGKLSFFADESFKLNQIRFIAYVQIWCWVYYVWQKVYRKFISCTFSDNFCPQLHV